MYAKTQNDGIATKGLAHHPRAAGTRTPYPDGQLVLHQLCPYGTNMLVYQSMHREGFVFAVACLISIAHPKDKLVNEK